MNPIRHLLTIGVAVLSLAVCAIPAFAKGGGEINNTVSFSTPTTTTAPEPAPQLGWDLCPDYAGAFLQPDGSTLFGNIGIGTCMVSRVSPTGALSIYGVYQPAGWHYTVKTSDPNRLMIEYTDPFTGDRHSILVEPGRTKIT